MPIDIVTFDVPQIDFSRLNIPVCFISLKTKHGLGFGMFTEIYSLSVSVCVSLWTHDVIATSILRQNHVVTSFWRYYYVVCPLGFNMKIILPFCCLAVVVPYVTRYLNSQDSNANIQPCMTIGLQHLANIIWSKDDPSCSGYAVGHDVVLTTGSCV